MINSTITYLRFGLLLLLIITLNHSCKKTENITVQYAGALKDMMHRGDLSSRIKLDTLKNISNLYALGALENLKGEILILNGEMFISSVKKDSLIVNRSFDYNAALLVFTQIEKWQEITIPEHIRNYQQVEAFIPEIAKKHKLNINEPFPFIISGRIESAQWHVIDWEEGDSDHTPEKHKSSGLRGIISNREVRILGFYSDKHQGIFTHHSTNLHLHILTYDRQIAAHLDDFLLGENILLLPDVK